MKIRSILAYIIDWNLSGLPALAYAYFYRGILMENNVTTLQIKDIPGLLIFFLVVLSFPALFVLRDCLFGGRSLAKRIFNLRVIDRATNRTPSVLKLIIRNLFFFIYPIDGLILLVTGNTIGCMVTDTAVVNNR